MKRCGLEKKDTKEHEQMSKIVLRLEEGETDMLKDGQMMGNRRATRNADAEGRVWRRRF